MATAEKKSFSAEVNKVLDLVINSLYSNKDIFLRELISNSSDALDKLRITSLSNTELNQDSELVISISADEEKAELTVADNGIGMDAADLENNLGVIAKSGTKEFLDQNASLSKEAQENLIGQFGVGFYSAFIVADKVEVVSKKAGQDKIYLWASEAKSEYSVEELTEEQAKEKYAFAYNQGTKIILKLKADDENKYSEYLQEFKLRSIIKEYSDFVEHPIKLRVEDTEVDGDEKEFLWETINSQKAIWTKAKSEISEDEYKDFYKHISNDFSEPLDKIHYRAEGTNEFTALLYVPEKPGMELFMPENKKGLNLYINRVFISNEAELLLAPYLRFVKGVVDASDLPLNVSREMLQDNPKVSAIKKNISKKVLSFLKDLCKKDKEKYLGFYKNFGKVIKEGVHLDQANKDKVLDLLFYETSSTEAGEMISLADYVERANSEQKEIFYIAGETRAELENSPYLESFKKKNIEVVFMTDSIDEWVAMSGREYKEKAFKSITQGDLNLDEEEKKELDEKQESNKDFLEFLKEKINAFENEAGVSEVKYSSRLVDTPCCLIASDMGISANLERIYKNANQEIPMMGQAQQRVLEINPEAMEIQDLERRFQENKAEANLPDLIYLLYSQAMLNEGSKLKNPGKFSKLLNKYLFSNK